MNMIVVLEYNLTLIGVEAASYKVINSSEEILFSQTYSSPIIDLFYRIK